MKEIGKENIHFDVLGDVLDQDGHKYLLETK